MSPDPRASSRPTRADDRASARPPEDADVGTVGDEPGLLERAGSDGTADDGDDDEPPVIDDIDRFEDGVFLNGNTANDDGGGA